MRQLKITKQVTNRETVSLDKYLHEISKEGLITADQEVELAKKIKQGDAKALEKFHQGEMNMIMPTIKSLEALAQFSSREEAFNHFKDLEDGAIPPILPKFIKKDGAWIGFLPGDDGYESA